MKYITITILFISSMLNSQVTFNKRYGEHTYSGGGKIYPIDNNFIITGKKENASEEEPATPLFMVIDKYGNILYNEHYETDVCKRSIYNYVKTEEDDFIGVGYTFSPEDDCWTTDPDGNTVTGGLYYHKVDKTGKLIWAKVIDSLVPNSTAGGDIVQVEDGNFFILGSYNFNVAIYKINTDGDILWVKEIGGSTNNRYFIEKVSGGYLCRFQSRFFKIDEDGNLLWNKYVYAVLDATSARTNDGGFVFSSYVMNNPNYPKTRFTKINEDAEIVWDYIIDSLRSGGFAITETRDGNFILGYVDVAKIDSLGNKLWQKKIYESDYVAFHNDIYETDDGGLLFSGRDYNYAVIKTDCEGNLTWDFNACPTYSTNELFQVYPNPIGNYFNISIPSTMEEYLLNFEIYDITGKKVKSLSFQNQKNIGIETYKLTNGMYFYSILHEGKQIQTGKLIKE